MGGPKMGPMMDPRSRFFMALASDQRLRLIQALRGGERSSAELVEILELDPSVVSRHLMLLRNVGIVSARKEGVTMYFSIADERIFQILDLATGMIRDWLDRYQQMI